MSSSTNNSNKTKKWFIGWANIKWGITEIIKIYSSSNSFFSKKRIESGIAFIIAQWGMVYWLIQKYESMTTSDLAIWAGIEFGVSGYILHQIQKEKGNINDPSNLEEAQNEQQNY
jgi:hypothetical protein